MGLAIASVYVLGKENMEQIDRILSIAISVFKTLNLFCCPLEKLAQINCLSKVDTKRR
jgi:hypothetical protein